MDAGVQHSAHPRHQSLAWQRLSAAPLLPLASVWLAGCIELDTNPQASQYGITGSDNGAIVIFDYSPGFDIVGGQLKDMITEQEIQLDAVPADGYRAFEVLAGRYTLTLDYYGESAFYKCDGHVRTEVPFAVGAGHAVGFKVSYSSLCSLMYRPPELVEATDELPKPEKPHFEVNWDNTWTAVICCGGPLILAGGGLLANRLIRKRRGY